MKIRTDNLKFNKLMVTPTNRHACFRTFVQPHKGVTIDLEFCTSYHLNNIQKENTQCSQRKRFYHELKQVVQEDFDNTNNTVKSRKEALGLQRFVSTFWGVYIRGGGLIFGGHFVLVSEYQDLKNHCFIQLLQAKKVFL